MQIKDFLDSVCKHIQYKPIRKNISEELKNHIEELKENYIKEGIEEENAEIKAIEQMGDSQEIGKKLNKIHRPKFDWKLLLIVLVLLCFGFLITCIRARNLEYFGMEWKFIRAIIIGGILSIGIYFFDYKKILKYSNILYGLATISILWTIWFGIPLNGIPHLNLGFGFAISVNVIAVPLYVIAFAGYLIEINQKSTIQELFNQTRIKVNIRLIKIIVLSIISLILLVTIPSSVSALILGVTYLVLGTIKILKTEKIKKKKDILILWGIPFIVVILLTALYMGGTTYCLERVKVWFHPERDPEGSGWIGINQKRVIDSAKKIGEADNMTPAINLFDEGTNFAFISILAHYGWIVAIGMVITILLLNIKLIINSTKVKDFYGKLLIVGISCIFFMQSIFNILMNLNIGIPANFNLPFVSYGRIELIINMVNLAFILSIYRRKNIIDVERNSMIEKAS